MKIDFLLKIQQCYKFCFSLILISELSEVELQLFLPYFRVLVFEDSLFSSSYDRTIRRWDFNTGTCFMIYKGHTLGVYPMAFIPREDEKGEDEDFEGFKDEKKDVKKIENKAEEQEGE